MRWEGNWRGGKGVCEGTGVAGERTAYSLTAASRAPISSAVFMREGRPNTACVK